MMLTPIDFYNKQIASGEILEDAQQRAAIQKFQLLYQNLVKSNPKKRGLLRRVKRHSETSGVYIWGDVGIGKTFLVDAFFYCLPFKDKIRIHFYQFMRNVHEALKKLEGTPNPLRHIAREWSEKSRVICLDELIVNDIADAMLLGDLINSLIKEGICIIFTSNIAPDNLYPNGLQRDRFLPAIEGIKENLEVIHLSTQDDYRTLDTSVEKYYWYPLTIKNQQNITKTFSTFSKTSSVNMKPITICNREIRIKGQSGNAIWFDFEHICGRPRGNQDYLEIADQFNTVFISDVTVISEQENDLARSLIQLVDVFYDAGVQLVMSGAVPIDQIYPKGKLTLEFERTRSRLTQMLSGDWEGVRDDAEQNVGNC